VARLGEWVVRSSSGRATEVSTLVLWNVCLWSLQATSELYVSGWAADEAEIITSSHHHMCSTEYGNDSRRSDLKISRYIV
jgi:hypothetical protein